MVRSISNASAPAREKEDTNGGIFTVICDMGVDSGGLRAGCAALPLFSRRLQR